MSRAKGEGMLRPAGRTRLQWDFSKEEIDQLDALKRQMGARTRSEVVRRLLKDGQSGSATGGGELQQALNIIQELAKKIPDIKSG